MSGLVVIERTKTGKPVLSGVFSFYDTRSTALVEVVRLLDGKGCEVSWQDFYDDAVAAGWEPGTTITRMERAIRPVHGENYWTGVRNSLG